jgi:phosphoglycerate dehydrogenase-like enzyme
MTRFSKLVVLDPILLQREQVDELHELAHEVTFESGWSTEAVAARVNSAEAADGQFCWTELGIREYRESELVALLKDADAVVSCWTDLPDAVLLQCKKLRYIGYWTNLVEHRVNLKLAQKLGIHVTYLPEYGTQGVAEYALTGLLGMLRRTHRAQAMTRRGSWPYELLKSSKSIPVVEELSEASLFGKQVGLVGLGRIGSRFAEMVEFMGAKVSYWSQSPKPFAQAKGWKCVSLDELFTTSHIVSLHLSPYAPTGIIGEDLFTSMQQGAILINTGSGRNVDEDAMFRSAEAGKLRLFLDVYRGLPPRKRIQQLSQDDHLFTYRQGWFSRDIIQLKGRMLLQKIREFIDSELSLQLKNAVTAK